MITEKGLKNFYSGKRVFLTGHTGFKGAWMALWLRSLGAEVTGYALSPKTNPDLFHILKLEDHVTHLEADVRNLSNLDKAVDEYSPDIVFHLAAQSLVKYSYVNPVETFETNVLGAVNVLESVRTQESVKAMINITSDKCYENLESESQSFKETDPMGGADPYSASKGCSELVTSSYYRSYFKEQNKGLATVRAGNVIGGGDWAENRLIPDCVRSFVEKNNVLIRNPLAVRPWQHVFEAIYGYLLLGVKLYESPETYSQAWNFGPEVHDIRSVENVVDQFVELWGENAAWLQDENYHPYEAKELLLNIEKVQKKLNWHPVWKLDEALSRTVRWYQSYYRGENMYEKSMEDIHMYLENIS